MIRVALVGNAGIGSQDHQNSMYRPAFERHPRFELVDTAEEAEVLSIAVPLAERGTAVADAIRAGKHVLADKPLAATLAEATEIERLAAAHGVVVVPAHHQRFGAALRSAIAAVRAGRVGLPWNVQCDFVVAGGDPAPTGELVNFGLYPVDVLRALLGLEVHRVHATGTPDLVTLLLDHEHGVTSTVVCGRVPALRDVPPGGLAVHRYRISGSHGVLAVDARKPALQVRTTDTFGPVWTGPGTVDVLLDVLAAGIAAGRAALGPHDAVQAQRVIEAAQRSMAVGQPVAIGQPVETGE
ncbi:Gfo/Idh/MocA family oxidoreductase [Plantactinospora sp. S1510]|uniref:Gfo/Idh/MocA family oxidoreductase n=1 Tax=Plantactinospora alkalitolerans TaxID=2789879 RepID=A0ABS0GTW5_9ACTN|nr:Gfo/Idh/MocA family oxidoreductase [Plantactinospora alkalitolerans]MBF9129649.1 Gfo/Idh/MocA family oxidoreductase [Plantactinospora alkalitolerans]